MDALLRLGFIWETCATNVKFNLMKTYLQCQPLNTCGLKVTTADQQKVTVEWG